MKGDGGILLGWRVWKWLIWERQLLSLMFVCKGKLVSFSNLSFSNSTNQKYAAHVKKIVYTLVYKLLEAKYVVKSRHTFWRNFYIFENTNGGLIPITKVICTIFVKIVYLNVTQLQVLRNILTFFLGYYWVLFRII